MNKLLGIAVALSVSVALAGDREDAPAFTPEQAIEHAQVFCTRAAAVNVSLDDDRRLQLCGSSYDHALVRMDDVQDLFGRMNSEALRDGWVLFGPTHGTTVVFKLRRNRRGLFEAPRVAFVAGVDAPPIELGAAALREWLADRPEVAAAGVSPDDGAVIAWGPSSDE